MVCAAVLCEPLSCVVHALDKLPTIDIGSNILIIGAGIIGLLWSSVLHVMGHRRVIISEPNHERKKIAEDLGEYSFQTEIFFQLQFA